MLGLENLTQSWIRAIILVLCCVAEFLLVSATFVLPLWEIPGTPGYLDSGPLKESYLSSSLQRSTLQGMPLLLSVLMGLMAGLSAPLVHFFGTDLVKWAYTKATSVEYGSEFMAAKISDFLLGQCVAILMSSMFTAAFLTWNLREDEERLAGGFYAIVGIAPFMVAGTALKLYLPWAPADSCAEDAEETQNLIDGRTEADDASSDDFEAGQKKGWWSKKADNSSKQSGRKESNDSDSNENESFVNDNASIESDEPPKRGWFW